MQPDKIEKFNGFLYVKPLRGKNTKGGTHILQNHIDYGEWRND